MTNFSIAGSSMDIGGPSSSRRSSSIEWLPDAPLVFSNLPSTGFAASSATSTTVQPFAGEQNSTSNGYASVKPSPAAKSLKRGFVVPGTPQKNPWY